MAVTIQELAEYRWQQRGEQMPEEATMADYNSVGLAMLGGCGVCEASIAAYNAHPTKTGWWFCASCVGPFGFETVEEANTAIFESDDEEDHDASKTVE